MSGNLVVNPRSARLTRDTDFFTKMDPFCVLRLGGQKVQTKVASGAGKTPIWNEQFTLRRNLGEDIVNVEVWDQDSVTKNDLVGEGSFAVTSVNSGGKSTQTCVLSYKGKKAGEVTVDVEFFPDNKKDPSQAGFAGLPMGFMPIPQFAFQMAGIPVQSYVPPVYPGYQQPGAFPSPMGFSQAPPMGYSQAPTMGYPQTSSVYPGFQPPAYQQPPAGGYQQPPAGGYQQPPAGGYQQPPAGGYQQPPAGGYQQPPAGGFQQPPTGGQQQPPAGGFQQPPAGGYQQQPPAGGYQQQPPAGGYQQQPPAGGYQQQPPSGGYQQAQYSSQPSWGGAPQYK